MRKAHKSYCPINLSLEVFGDRWTLLVLRDMIFGDRRHFRELLDSEERISSNILSDRLRMLLEHGLVTRSDDPTHRQKLTYRLTEKSITLVPVFAQIGAWGQRFLPVSRELGVRMDALNQGGPPMWDAFMDELREIHLGPAARRRPRSDAPSVRAILSAAYEQVVTAGAPSTG
jgi:DNA-binding HxlR family transcriptional regulator